MIHSRSVLALIPARGGSKGVPRKNLAIVGGSPLISWTVEASLGARHIDHVWLSSDDDEILEVGGVEGVQTLKRPAVLASDVASSVDVVMHFLANLPASLAVNDPYIVYLQPTSPLRRSQHIDEAFAAMEKSGLHSLISVVELEASPFKAFKIDSQGRMESLFDEQLSNARRQDLPRTVIPNGAIYIFRRSEFLARKGFPSNGSHPFVMQVKDSIDLDTPEDLVCLNQILENSRG